jgi:outer membrane protein
MNDMKSICAAAVLFFVAAFTPAAAQNTVLDEYIRQGLAANKSLDQQRLMYLKTVSQESEAKGLFLPELSLNARYTVAHGGRTITFPVKDIFDGYSALNNYANPEIHLITPEEFKNEEIYFLRRTEQETKISLVQPLFNTDIFFNAKIQKEMSSAGSKQYAASARRLVYEIRKAYFTYLKAEELYDWTLEAKKLSAEFVRVNESLMKNDKITAGGLFRAKAEDARVDQEISEALRMKMVSQSYFNYLVGKPAEDPVIASDTPGILSFFSSADQVAASSLQAREELGQLDFIKNAADYGVRLYSSEKLPTIAAAADYGFQGEQYRFTGDDDYMLASLVLKWDLFDGFQKKEKLKQAMLDMQTAQAAIDDARQQIEMEARDAWYGFLAAGSAMQTSIAEQDAMEKAFEMINKKYENGQAGMLEYTDAKTEWSRSVMNRITKKYDYYIAYFNLLRVSASEDINNYINLNR